VIIVRGEFSMCGIIGYIGDKSADKILIDGLKKLEYRGYDSAGIAIIENHKLDVYRSVGKLVNLENVLSKIRLHSTIGLGHTRWATHGKPSENNAHPHISDNRKIVVVHNGIIENYLSLKNKLAKKYKFRSETDTEVLAHLIEDYYSKYKKDKNALLKAVQRAVKDVVGSYAIGVMSLDDPDTIIAARKSSPLIIGIGKDESFLASDVSAILRYTNKVIILEDGETALIKKNQVIVYDEKNISIKKSVTSINWDPVSAEKGGYKHFMLKEIFEQPEVIRDTIRGRVDLEKQDIYLEDVKLTQKDISSIKRVIILACGTSYHAGLIARFWIEDFAKIPCEVDIGSEFRYRNYILDENCLIISISQSGETADTLASVRNAKKIKLKDIAVCNVVDSTLAREASNILYTRCGPEIGVASTKAFTGQLTALFILSIFLAKRRNKISKENMKEMLDGLVKLPLIIEKTLKETKDVMENWAKIFFKKSSFLYLGRNSNYPIALEGALKLKEISYIHAEGYPAGEMKHGPIALIDENMPVLAIATESPIYEKVISNIEEAKARDGIILAIATKGDKEIKDKAGYVCFMPRVLEFLTPIINVIPLQLLAYYIAVKRGCDVDQPRNLAKSVTVE
jgi:glutamine---fructose-6-phosphate transaminase (isomerizing)